MKPQFISRQIPATNIPETNWWPEIVKALIFSVAFFTLFYAIGWNLVLALVFATLFGFAALILFNAWRSHRELQGAAFDVWCDRVCAIVAAQYDTRISRVEFGAWAASRWRVYYDRGFSPERAVSQYVADVINGARDDD